MSTLHLTVFTTDPGMGDIRHADAGHEEAIDFAKKNDINLPTQAN
jgi:urocanate hydratase